MDRATGPTGLSQAEARRRLAAEGPNVLPSRESHGIAHIALHVLREPMFVLLVAAAAIYLVLGEPREALVLGSSIVVVLAITVVQERRTERALERLRDLSSPRALVIRDGAMQRIAGADVVRGDLVLLREGDRVAADGALLEAHDLAIDESLLTGESVAADKDARANREVFSGTLVVRGQGMAEVTATGARSEIGRIGGTLATIVPEKTAIERETARVVRVLALVAGAVCIAAAVAYVATRGNLLDGMLAGLTLAMAMLPEEFPVVLTIFLALGAWRLSRHGVLTRRMPAIEMLGAATVLCCDKTGTLTENRMAVAELWRDGRWRVRAEWSDAEVPLLEAAALACETEPFDPMERAIVEAALRLSPRAGDLRAQGTLAQRHPLTESFLAVAHGWSFAGGKRLCVKGAPEAVLRADGLERGERDAALAEARSAAARGLRLLAVAEDEAPGAWREDVHDYRLRFLGFVALADPVRKAVPEAIARCRAAGIRVVMITGDHPHTAAAIAREAGIDAARVMSGAEVAALDDAMLAREIAGVHVFARVRPEQKLKLVKALRAAGGVVAMTGDGVNDAPALKAAHIGIAMGTRGSDVAREAAALVLLDDDFTAMVGAVRLGRRIYDNIRNAMRYLVAVHVPLAGMAFIPLAAGWPFFFYPLHVVFLEFVIDPACAVVFEAERSDPRSMQRPPRPASQALFDRTSLGIGALLGLSALACVAVVYGVALGSQHDAGAARAMAFTALVCANLALIAVNRSHRLTVPELLRRTNAALRWIVPCTLVALVATIYVPALADLFRFAPLDAGDLAASAAAGALSVAWYDALKLARRRRA